MTPLPGVQEEARRILASAVQRGVALRLIGGVGVSLRCPSASKVPLCRTYVDIDLVAHERQSRAINEFFHEMGYRPRVRFNAMMGRKRLIFNDITYQRRVDVFLDVFEMCHRFDFADRIELEPLTLPLADLLATKLQIVQMDQKDLKDIAAIFLDHDVGSADGETINGAHLSRLCADDWGVYKTLTINIANLNNCLDVLGLSPAEVGTTRSRIATLAEMIENEPKTLLWKLRARVGEKKRWYELPEADEPFVIGASE